MVSIRTAERKDPPLRSLAIPLCLFLGIVALFSPARGFEFLNFDDNVYITSNPAVLGGLTTDGARWAFTTTEGGHWHPLSWLSHQLDIELFGLNAGAHHLESVILHGINTVLLYLLLLRGIGNRRVAFFSALLFGCSPMRLESVVWVSQRKDLLSLCLALISLNCYQRFLQAPSRALFYSALIFFGVALLAKPTVITLPFLLILLDLVQMKQIPTSLWSTLFRSLSEKVPFLALAGVFACVVILSQSSGGGLRSVSEISLPDRFDLVMTGYLSYLGKLLWPVTTTIFYPQIRHHPGIGVGAFVALTGLTIFLWNHRSRYPELILGWSWMVVTLLPVCGVLAVGGQAYADRWSYLSFIGPVSALVYLLYRHLRTKVAADLICTGVAGIFITLTWMNLPHWRSSEAVFRHALSVNPHNFMAHTNLGNALEQSGTPNEIAFHYEEAARLNPTFPEALNNLGITRARQGRYREAVELFDRALSIRPGFVDARENRKRVVGDLR